MHTCVCECFHVYACLSLLCIIVCEQQLRAAAAAHSFFFCFVLFLSLPLICDLSSFRRCFCRQSSNSSHSRVEYLVWPQQLTRLHGVHFFARPPSLCLHIRPSIVKHVFYCVCVYVLYSGLSTYIHRNVCLMPAKWG